MNELGDGMTIDIEDFFFSDIDAQSSGASPNHEWANAAKAAAKTTGEVAAKGAKATGTLARTVGKVLTVGAAHLVMESSGWNDIRSKDRGRSSVATLLRRTILGGR